jgi:uncharacterized membrane protein required for colicin V production
MQPVIPIVTGIDAKVLGSVIGAILEQNICPQLNEIMTTIQEIRDAYAVLKSKLEQERVEFVTFTATVIDKITKLQEKLDQSAIDLGDLEALKAEIISDTESVSSIVVTPEGFSPAPPEPELPPVVETPEPPVTE